MLGARQAHLARQPTSWVAPLARVTSNIGSLSSVLQLAEQCVTLRVWVRIGFESSFRSNFAVCSQMHEIGFRVLLWMWCFSSRHRRAAWHAGAAAAGRGDRLRDR